MGEPNHKDHRTFAGVIYPGDFDGYTSMTVMAERIEADARFDRQCDLRHRTAWDFPNFRGGMSYK